MDIILPRREYDGHELYLQINAIQGSLFQQLSRFEQLTKRQIESRSAIDSRLGGVDERLDKLEQRLETVEGQLTRLLEILESQG